MGGRGASGVVGIRGGAGGGGGGAFTVTPNAGGGVTITPNANNNNNNNNNNQQFTGAGSGVSDTNTHTTYFTPADKAIVSNDVTDGFDFSVRSGQYVPRGYYQTGYYANVNSGLRDLANGRSRRLDPHVKTIVDAMDRNMRPLNNDMDTTRWTDLRALSDNLGMRGASERAIINRLAGGDIISTKHDYTSSSYNANANTVAGQAGRNVRLDYHYSKGAMGQFSPTRKEGEFVGARDVDQRYSNARVERTLQKNAIRGNRYVDVLVVDVYVK